MLVDQKRGVKLKSVSRISSRGKGIWRKPAMSAAPAASGWLRPSATARLCEAGFFTDYANPATTRICIGRRRSGAPRNMWGPLPCLWISDFWGLIAWTHAWCTRADSVVVTPTSSILLGIIAVLKCTFQISSVLGVICWLDGRDRTFRWGKLNYAGNTCLVKYALR